MSPRPAVYDPYDEDFSVPEPTYKVDAENETARHERVEEDARVVAETEAQEARAAETEKEAQRVEQLHAGRDTDDFVNMPFGRASVVVTQRLNEQSVMRRMKEVSFGALCRSVRLMHLI
jgi:hypothetical protein